MKKGSMKGSANDGDKGESAEKKHVVRKGSPPGSARRAVVTGVRSGKGRTSKRVKKQTSVKLGSSSKVQVIKLIAKEHIKFHQECLQFNSEKLTLLFTINLLISICKYGPVECRHLLGGGGGII